MHSQTVVSGDAAHLEYDKWICDTKKKYPTWKTARLKAAERVQIDQTLTALYAYRCKACGSLHLTKKPRGRALAWKPAPMPDQPLFSGGA